jgi:phenylalanyl-tRNA synthetase beta chain
VFELSLTDLLGANVEEIKYEAIPRFPSIGRDIALVVDRNIPAGELEAVIKETGGRLLTDVQVFDVYEGEKIDASKKSVAFALRYYHPEHTLTDEEVNKVHTKVLKAVEEKFDAVLRS